MCHYRPADKQQQQQQRQLIMTCQGDRIHPDQRHHQLTIVASERKTEKFSAETQGRTFPILILFLYPFRLYAH